MGIVVYTCRSKFCDSIPHLKVTNEWQRWEGFILLLVSGKRKHGQPQHNRLTYRSERIPLVQTCLLDRNPSLHSIVLPAYRLPVNIMNCLESVSKNSLVQTVVLLLLGYLRLYSACLTFSLSATNHGPKAQHQRLAHLRFNFVVPTFLEWDDSLAWIAHGWYFFPFLLVHVIWKMKPC